MGSKKHPPIPARDDVSPVHPKKAGGTILVAWPYIPLPKKVPTAAKIAPIDPEPAPADLEELELDPNPDTP